MAVYIQSESDGRMAQVLRYCLDRIPDPDGVGRVCVAEVMETGLRNPDLCHDCFQVLQDRVVNQVSARLIHKDKIFFIHPGSAGSQFVFCLLLPDFVQHLHYVRRRLKHPGLIVLRREELVLAGAASFADLLQLLLDRDGAGSEIHAVPGQAENLALPHAGKYVDKEEIAELIVFDLCQEIREMLPFNWAVHPFAGSPAGDGDGVQRGTLGQSGGSRDGAQQGEHRFHLHQRDENQGIRQTRITALHLRVGRLFCCGFWQVFMLQLVKLFLNLFTGGDVGAQEQHRA